MNNSHKLISSRVRPIEHAANGGASFEPARTGLNHLSFPTSSIEELEQWAGWLNACNVSHSGVKDVVAGVGGMLNFLDPDGIQLELLFVDREKLRQERVRIWLSRS